MISAIRGMNDILPSETPLWALVEGTLRDLTRQFAYQEIRIPILEKTELFKRCIGDVTDIVEKEMYTFADRNGDSLSLRPEGTAGCVRAGIEQGLFYNQIQRLWYMGPMFRHERPQKGRYRQFYQFGLEAVGIVSADIDAEIIAFSACLLKTLGLSHRVVLEINSLGTKDVRLAYRERLIAYFSAHDELLDEEAKRRLHTNPLRILDSKNPAMKDLIAAAPNMHDCFDDASRAHFESLCGFLDALQISYKVNPRLVRGLDYYTHTVFEWVTDALGAQNTVCAGGRYDGLIEQLGGKATPGIGFALGIDRVIALLEMEQKKVSNEPDFIVLSANESAMGSAMAWTMQFRARCPEYRVLQHCGGGSLKNQMKRADKSGARYAVIFGDDVSNQAAVTLKHLRVDRPPETFTGLALLDYLEQLPKELLEEQNIASVKKHEGH